MHLKLCFSGWLFGEITEVWDPLHDTKIPVNENTKKHVLEMLQAGKYTIDLGQLLVFAKDKNVEIFDIEENI